MKFEKYTARTGASSGSPGTAMAPCTGAGFANCYATTAGTTNDADAGGSPTVYKRDSDGSQSFGGFSSVTGSEFTISYTRIGNSLSFTYTPGANDPEIHYFTVKQASGYALFYDLTNAITAANTGALMSPAQNVVGASASCSRGMN